MRKLVFLPLRLAVGWGLSPRLLGLIGTAMLVLLRVTIGCHFYTEGIDKYSASDWSAAPFFANAKGPFAEHYRTMVWDADGAIRLDRARVDKEWKWAFAQISSHYGFDKEQNRQASANYLKALQQYDWVMTEKAADLEEFELGKERNIKLDNDPVRNGVSSLGGQRDSIRKEWNAKGAAALKEIDAIWKGYIGSQLAVATSDQLRDRKPFEPNLPRDVQLDTSVVDSIIPYFDMAIGLCLLLGFLTPVASLAAAGFLFSVFLSQFPPTSGPSSTYFQLVESMACLVLAGTGAGRFAGFDYFLHLLVRKYGVERVEVA